MPTPISGTSASASSFSNSPTSLTNAPEVSSAEVESNPERVLARGYGLSTGVAGQPNSFKLDARNAGFGDFDVVIKGASRATIEYIEEEEALYKIKYHVALPGDYQIEIKYDLKHIPGSPFTAKVMDPNNIESNKLECSSTRTNSIESFSTFNEPSDDDTSLVSGKVLPINGTVETPSGKLISGNVIQKPNGKITVKFARTEIGLYKVTLRHKNGDVIRGSPYEVMVRAKEVSTSMTAYGSGLKLAKVEAANCFTVFGSNGIDVTDLCIVAYGAGVVKLKVFQNDWNSVDVVYEVNKHGKYFFHIHEHGRNIAESPFSVATTLADEVNGTNTFSAMIIAIWHGREHDSYPIKTCMTLLDEEKTVFHYTSKRGRHLLDVKFLPSQNGVYVLDLFKDDTSMRQTFQLPVENLARNDNDVVTLKGHGLHTSVVNKPASVFVHSSLPLKSFSIEFDGPSTVHIVQKRLENRECLIEYTGHMTGCYVMSIKYDGFHIARSPYYINMVSDDTILRNIPLAIKDKTAMCSDASKCIAKGESLNLAIAGEVSSFTVDTTNAGEGGIMAGFADVSIPTEVTCKNIGNCLYSVQYAVNAPGTFKLSVFWSGKNIPGSPFAVHVSDGNNNRKKE